jgi:arsenate reductase-like glutaredoxin family protein/molybdenum-dependent DNA-binding transcriptional regulator ModE
MAIQILPPRTGLGERLGTALGTGLSSGIQGLLSNKLEQMQRQQGLAQTQAGLSALGISPDIAGLPADLQSIAVKEALARPRNQAYDKALSDLLQGTTSPIDNEQLSQLSPQQKTELTKVALKQRNELQRQKEFETRQGFAEQREVNRETLPFFQETNKAAKAARDNNTRLQRMNELINSGKLTNPLFYSILRSTGFDFPALMTADSQEFRKLSTDFLKNAKEVFGSRLTNFDVTTFLQTVPDLALTDEGKKRLITNLENFNNGALLRQQAMNEIIRDNNGRRPANIEELVDERVGPQLDALAEQFAQGTQKSEQQPIKGAPNVQAQTGTTVPQNEELPPSGPQTLNPGAPTLSGAGNVLRQLGRTAARATESVIGLPGDILSTGLGLGNALTGNQIPGVETIQQYLPTSENLRNIVTKTFTGQTLEPQNEAERIGDELVSDFATFAIPIKGKIPFKSAAAKSILGNAAGFLGEKIGGPIGKGVAKIGTVLGLSFAGGRKALQNVMQQSYQNAENLAGTAKESAKELGKDVTAITKDVTSGIKTPGKEFVAGSIRGISDAIKNNKISVKDAWSLKKDVNELLRDPETPKTASKYLGRLGESLNKVLNAYGKNNPEFGQAFHQAEDIYRGLNKASDIAKTIQNSVKPESLTSNVIKNILTAAAFKTPGALPALGATVAGASSIRGITRFTQLLKNSAEARRYYGNIVKAAVKQNPSLIQRNAQKLDKLATEQGY